MVILQLRKRNIYKPSGFKLLLVIGIKFYEPLAMIELPIKTVLDEYRFVYHGIKAWIKSFGLVICNDACVFIRDFFYVFMSTLLQGGLYE
jgi:hypothetical protein